MIFSYRNNPLLSCIENKSLGQMPILESDQEYFKLFLNNFVTKWKYYADYFKNVNVISSSFYEATTKASLKLANLFNEIMKNNTEDFSVSGTYVIGDVFYMLHYEAEKGSEDLEIMIFLFHKKGMPLGFYQESGKQDINGNGWISNSLQNSIENDAHDFLMKRVSTVIIMEMFKRYAEVETKFLGPNSRTKHENEKFLNETKIGITYLNSKWFTNLVKSDGFKVNGHFRLQPKKKDGEWTKELIWINDFEKSGYTSIAKIQQI